MGASDVSLPDDVETVSNEMRENETRAGRNVSDNCVLHYRTRVLERYLALRPGEISKVAQLGRTATRRRLIAAHPGREALWSYYRFVFARMVQGEPSLATDASFLADTTHSSTQCAMKRERVWIRVDGDVAAIARDAAHSAADSRSRFRRGRTSSHRVRAVRNPSWSTLESRMGK